MAYKQNYHRTYMRSRQAYRNPGMLDYRFYYRFHFFILLWSYNKKVCKYDLSVNMTKLSANVVSSWNSKLQHSGVSASLTSHRRRQDKAVPYLEPYLEPHLENQPQPTLPGY